MSKDYKPRGYTYRRPVFHSVLMLIATVVATAAASKPFSIGPWTPGMTREQTLAFRDNGPYTQGRSFSEQDASVQFQNAKTPVTLTFDTKGLVSLQLRKYEGDSVADAKAAALQVFDLFAKDFGGATVENVQADGGKPLDRVALAEALDKTLGTAREVAGHARRKDKSALLLTFDMVPNRQPAQSRLHSQWGYSSKGDRFYVYLFQDRIDAPLRRARSNVFLERIK